MADELTSRLKDPRTGDDEFLDAVNCWCDFPDNIDPYTELVTHAALVARLGEMKADAKLHIAQLKREIRALKALLAAYQRNLIEQQEDDLNVALELAIAETAAEYADEDRPSPTRLKEMAKTRISYLIVRAAQRALPEPDDDPRLPENRLAAAELALEAAEDKLERIGARLDTLGSAKSALHELCRQLQREFDLGGKGHHDGG